MDGEDTESSLKVFKSTTGDLRYLPSVSRPDQVEKVLDKSIARNKNAHSPLERSVGSNQHQRRAIRELLIYESGKARVGEGREVKRENEFIEFNEKIL